jgi:hypothetical protein
LDRPLALSLGDLAGTHASTTTWPPGGVLILYPRAPSDAPNSAVQPIPESTNAIPIARPLLLHLHHLEFLSLLLALLLVLCCRNIFPKTILIMVLPQSHSSGEFQDILGEVQTWLLGPEDASPSHLCFLSFLLSMGTC